ncbi:MAG: diguanylate cyclase/phosphodiesterase (GGDEF & EAL domains) with PAS/PAC sensor(s) [Brockia lithotrophica]|uniref:Diguanylate cyclase/phosphodiesterase (GGDEF & EAL domains) with PAS/PAC sensor(S) n=1 Tax=Brockia lithotrophica TaxID=933949 RepID=A0A2T5GAU3_9BACL|nr:GGDEF domain-containing protein [Brockia lithotrophica]PTQ53302.1 MAG: diguanylate cyclase/phosphodiesterase (GGDEF & EAL domains) with PAS/PAC sensor(s) [Brockia lithotrophica]
MDPTVFSAACLGGGALALAAGGVLTWDLWREEAEVYAHLHRLLAGLQASTDEERFVARVFAELEKLAPFDFSLYLAESGECYVGKHADALGWGREREGILCREMQARVLETGSLARGQVRRFILQTVVGPYAILAARWEDGGTVVFLRPSFRPFTAREERRLRFAIRLVEDVLVRVRRLLDEEAETQRDALTGFLLFGPFREVGERVLRAARERGEPVSLLLLDIDYFKRFNDTYGHEMGNELLRRLAALLKGMTRKEDVLARYGGEEFLVLLPRTDHAAALRVAERLRGGVARLELPSPDPDREHPRVTVSIGVATFPEHADDVAGLIHRADRAMYLGAKRRGRNRIASANQAPP